MLPLPAKPVVETYQRILAGNDVSDNFNNGFEQGDGQLPILWRIYKNESLGFTAKFARDATVSHNGAASASIASSTKSSLGEASFYLNPIQPVIPGKNYSLSAWVSGSLVTDSNTLSIAWFDINGHYLSQNFSGNAPLGEFGWLSLNVSAIAPTGAAMCEIHINSQANSGTVWFDDVGFQCGYPAR